MKNINNSLKKTNTLTHYINFTINFAIEFEDIDTPDWLDEESEDAVEM